MKNQIDKTKDYWIKLSPLHHAFFISYTTNDEPEWVKCHITEDRYKVDDHYKVTLTPYDKEHYPERHFYQMDFESMLKDGYAVVDKDFHTEDIMIRDMITPNVFIETIGQVLV